MHQQLESQRPFIPARLFCITVGWCLAVGGGLTSLWAQPSTSLVPSAVSTDRGSAQLESLLGSSPGTGNRPATSGHFLPTARLADGVAEHAPTNRPSLADSGRLIDQAYPHPIPQAGSPAGSQAIAQPVSHAVDLSAERLDAGPRRDPLHEQLPGPRPLGDDRGPRGDKGGGFGTGSLGAGGQSLMQTGIALALVLLLVFGCAWLLRKAGPKSLQPLPLEAVQLLGNAPLYGKQHLRLIRLGQRVLLLAVSESSTQTLTEVTDPDEVSQLLELCQSRHPQGHTKTFEALLREGDRERATGFLGSQQDQVPVALRRARSGDEAQASARTTGDGRPVARPASNHFFEA